MEAFHGFESEKVTGAACNLFEFQKRMPMGQLLAAYGEKDRTYREFAFTKEESLKGFMCEA